MKYGDYASAKLEPFKGATGESTALRRSSRPSPGRRRTSGRREHYRVDMAKYGFDIDLEGHNAIQGSFRFSV